MPLHRRLKSSWACGALAKIKTGTGAGSNWRHDSTEAFRRQVDYYAERNHRTDYRSRTRAIEVAKRYLTEVLGWEKNTCPELVDLLKEKTSFKTSYTSMDTLLLLFHDEVLLVQGNLDRLCNGRDKESPEQVLQREVAAVGAQESNEENQGPLPHVQHGQHVQQQEQDRVEDERGEQMQAQGPETGCVEVEGPVSSSATAQVSRDQGKSSEKQGQGQGHASSCSRGQGQQTFQLQWPQYAQFTVNQSQRAQRVAVCAPQHLQVLLNLQRQQLAAFLAVQGQCRAQQSPTVAATEEKEVSADSGTS